MTKDINTTEAQLTHLITKVIDERVPRIVNDIIERRVPAIVDERINKLVPTLLDERIKKLVPTIIDERITQLVPVIIDERLEVRFWAFTEFITKRFDKIEHRITRIVHEIYDNVGEVQQDHERRLVTLEKRAA